MKIQYVLDNAYFKETSGLNAQQRALFIGQIQDGRQDMPQTRMNAEPTERASQKTADSNRG